MITLELLAQTMVEAGKEGASTGQMVTWAAVAMAIVSSIGGWLIILRKNLKKSTLNPGPHPGEGKTCGKHGEDIIRHDTEIKNIVKGMDEARVENREAHQQIFEAINGLRHGR